MSPDGLQPTRQRKAWRAMSALGCVLGAASLFTGAVKWHGVDRRQDRQAVAAQRAVCAIVTYAEEQAALVRTNPRTTPGAAARLEQLARDMRATGIGCPPFRPDSP